MTYQDALEKINSRLLFGMQPGLERIEALLHQLGDPHKALRCVHVCGTNLFPYTTLFRSPAP